MDVPVITALIAAGVALVTSTISLLGQRRTALLQHQLEKARMERTKAAELQDVMAKFRRPLLQATADLQSRLFNILRCGFMQVYGCGSDRERQYAIESTLFVFAEFFGWVEALRREIQYLDLGNDRANREIQACLDEVSHEFRRDDLPPPFRVFRGELRAIGELMQLPRVHGGVECVGYAAFSRKLKDPEFSEWFVQLRADTGSLSANADVQCQRLERVHDALLRLIDNLDPDAIHVPTARRYRLVQPNEVQVLP